MMDISIIIINYNTIRLVIDCIESIFRHTEGVKYEIIVVDNASIDGSVSILKTRYPQLLVIANDKNVGFGQANNIGLTKAQGKYVFLLNSDTVLLNNAPKIFYDFMESQTERQIGVIGAIMLDSQYIPNYANSYNRFFTLYRCVHNTFISLFRPKVNYISFDRLLERDNCVSVDFVVGADMFCPKVALECVGGFDPQYFMYFEEVDMQLRLRNLGFERLIINGPRIIHLEGGSTSKQMTLSKWNMYSRSLFAYFRKNRPRAELFFLKFYYIVIAIFGGIFRFHKNNLRDKIAYIKAVVQN